MNYKCPRCSVLYEHQQECDWCPGVIAKLITAYRIMCKFEPFFKRAVGGVKGGVPFQERVGAWTIAGCFRSIDYERGNTTPVKPAPPNHIALFAARPHRLGTRCSPRKILNEWLIERRKQRGI